ncbi:MAG: PTS glucose transporter subunit IIA, partial [Coprobacillaceae bacterium]
GLRLNDGKEILIHIGMDTVQLNGEGFTSCVEVGDYVNQGDIIAKVDTSYITSKNKSLVSPVIFTSGEKIEVLKNKKQVKLLEEQIIKFN